MAMTMTMMITLIITKKYIDDWLGTIIDKTKSFEDEIKSLKKNKRSRALVYERLW